MTLELSRAPVGFLLDVLWAGHPLIFHLSWLFILRASGVAGLYSSLALFFAQLGARFLRFSTVLTTSCPVVALQALLLSDKLIFLL